jgi:hypothetical protein
MDFEAKVMESQAEFEKSLNDQGIVAEWDKLVGEVQTEMDGMNMNKLRLSVKALKNKKVSSATKLSVRNEFNQRKPSP